ncbi:MAG: HAD-IB family phosphatase [Patescibacteria group bacterium]|nr:HAD-IB family phosphatase [Patescibacteria group bacterium]
MDIKAILIDFDGTVVTTDILDVVCGIVGKEKESRMIKEEFFKGVTSGLSPLITRINFLKGVTTQQIQEKLSENDFLMPGAEEFFNFLNSKNYISILHSGNLVPILNHYKEKLGITYVVGTKPKMDNDTIVSISEKDFSGPDFKLNDSKAILDKCNISAKEVIAIGDSPADRTIFEFAEKSIAINPKEGIDKFADYVIQDDLSKAIDIIDSL